MALFTSARAARSAVVVLALVALTATVAAHAAVYPPCVEDNKIYSPVANGEFSFGTLTPITAACSTGTKSLTIAQSPSDSATIIAPIDDWMYAITAATANGEAGVVSFTVNALCDSTVICQAALRYNVQAAPLVPEPTEPVFPMCTSNSSVFQVEPGAALKGTLPMDLIDSDCTYTTAVVPPSEGRLAQSPTDPFAYTFTAPATDADVDFAYSVSCDGTTVCKDVVAIRVHRRYPTCSASDVAVTSRTPGSQISGTLALDLTEGDCHYTTAIDTPPHGQFTTSRTDPFQFTYTSPAVTMDASFGTEYRVMCDGVIVCEDTIAVTVSQQYPVCSRQPAAPIVSYRPSTVISGRFPLDLEDSTCTYTTAVDALPAGTMQLASPTSADPLAYVYTSPSSQLAASSAITYRVQCNGSVVCQDIIPLTIQQSYPMCTAANVTRTHAPGVSTTMDLPIDMQDSECTYTADLELPSVGSAVVMTSKYPALMYIFTAPYSNEGDETHLNYKIECNGEPVCQDSIKVLIREEAPECPITKVYYYVKPEGQLGGALDIGTSCGGALTTTVRSKTGTGVLQVNGLGYTFTATAKEDDNVAVVRAYCDNVPLCDSTVAFIVSNAPFTEPPVLTTTTTSVPGSTTSTESPLDACRESFDFKVPTGQKLRGSLHVPSVSQCELVTFSQPQNVAMKGSLGVNILGDFLYQAPVTQGIESATVTVSCVDQPVCKTSIRFTAYFDYNASTTTTTETPTVPACANVYYYHTAPGRALSTSLNGVPQQDPCTHGRYFSLSTAPQGGRITLMPIGDFLYQPTSLVAESNDVFTFSMYCMNRLYCNGIAYVTISNRWTLPPTQTTADPSKPAEITNKQITCRGSCDAKAWKTYPMVPMWDNSVGAGYNRADGRPVDGLTVRWVNSSLVFTVYTLIGNLGVRFPTFEPLLRSASRHLEAADFDATVARSSTGFERSCLNAQIRTGLGEDVYKWDTMDNLTGMGTGSLGALYSAGNSWYQKFGGKHDHCDTFVNACQYAPFLTPAYTNHSGGGVWTIDINDCDATWTGVFPLAALDNMTKSDGSALWSFSGNNQLSGSLVSEAVRPSSWISPKRFDAHFDEHSIIVNLDQFVLSSKANGNDAKFSIDTEFFLYRDEATGDQAFGVNMLVYPHVTDAMESSFSEDSHVVGFKWIEQDWSSPSQQDCPTCTGTKTHCKAASDLATTATYLGEFPAYDCPASVARVQLTKGPSMSTANCAENEMFVMNRTGFSAPRGCSTAFQNITFRGIVPGSGRLTEQQTYGFNYVGNVGLELLMNSTKRQRVNLNISVYVSRLALDSPTKAEGGLEVCRSGNYWPLPDPLGTSLPDAPFATSVTAPSYLCVDDLSSSYGPSDWALFTLSGPSLTAAQVAVNTVYVELNGGARVYLVYHDPATGAAAIPPAELGHWWQYTYPYLAFRDLTDRAANSTLSASPSMADSSALKNARYAFTMIPGTLGVDGTVEIVVSATITKGTVKSASTYRRLIHIDPLLTSLSRNGPPKVEEHEDKGVAKSDFYAIGVTAGITVALIAVVIFFMVADKNRPLPKWVPRGKVIKRTVLSVVPHGLRKERKPKPVVHRDMYDAMNSGRY